jgi:folate-dependent phosphoribosylglycinamide formyltransferase PurN
MSEQIISMHSGRPEDFVWAGFGSGKGTNLEKGAGVKLPGLVFTDKPSAGLLQIPILNSSGIEKIVMNGFAFCGSYAKAKGNPEAEAAYMARSREFNERILDALQDYEHRIGKKIDLIVLGGYMRFVLDPLLSAYKDRIINVHPAPLDILVKTDEGLKRKFVGGDAVYDMLVAGERKTRSSVIIVDEKEDHGEILTQGPLLVPEPWIYEIAPWAKETILRKFVDGDKSIGLRGFQDLQKEYSDWPAITFALRAIMQGKLALGTEKVHHKEWRRVYFEGRPLPYEGYEAPLINRV